MKEYILVVDDEEGIRFALRTHLSMLGYEVDEAPNGVEALRSIAKRKPDLMILDIMMSPMTGWEVLEQLHGNPATEDIRVLVLTTLGEGSHETLGWFLGCDWYQVKEKPLNFEDLALIVKSLLAVDPHEERRQLPQA